MSGTILGREELRERIGLGDPRRLGRALARTWDRVGLPTPVALLLFAGALVQSAGVASWPPWFDDEGTYVANAWAVDTGHGLAHYTYWYDHPPLGWLLLALWMWPAHTLSSVPAVVLGRAGMVVVQLVAGALLYVLGRRLGMRPFLAGVAVALFTFCPLALYYHRMVLLDNLAIPWLLAAFALALTPQRRLVAFGASGACFAAAVLTKETVLVLLPALVLQVWLHADPRTRAICLTVFGSLFALIGAFYPLYAALKNELLPGAGHVSLLDAISFQLFTRRPSGFFWRHGTDANAIVHGWAHLDPWLVPLGAVAGIGLLVVPRFRAVALALLIGVAMLFRPGYLPIPYVVTLLPFGALLVAGGLDVILRRRRVGLALAVACFAAAGFAVAPGWTSLDERMIDGNARIPGVAAVRWVSHHVPRSQALIVDNTVWVDLVHRGYPRRNVVWFSKLDLDPGVLGKYPRGYREFDYILWSAAMREAPDAPQSRAAFEHSCLVRRFGFGESRIEIRRIDPSITRSTCAPAGRPGS